MLSRLQRSGLQVGVGHFYECHAFECTGLSVGLSVWRGRRLHARSTFRPICRSSKLGGRGHHGSHPARVSVRVGWAGYAVRANLQRRACASSGSSDPATDGSPRGDSKEETADVEAGSATALADARDLWHTTVGGGGRNGVLDFRPRPHVGITAWLQNKLATHHAKNVARWQSDGEKVVGLEEDLAEGAPLSLRSLAASIAESLVSPTASGRCLLQPRYEDHLGERLRSMVDNLRDAGWSGKWDIKSIEAVEVQRFFLMVGASRSGARAREGPTILCMFGQQFMLTDEQAKLFLDKSFQGRMGVMQELILSPALLVADVSVSVRQASVLRCPKVDGPSSAASAEAAATPESEGVDTHAAARSTGRNDAETHAEGDGESVVDHILRLELPLVPDRNFSGDPDDMPMLRASSWYVADWNWACLGNHPAPPRGTRAPW